MPSIHSISSTGSVQSDDSATSAPSEGSGSAGMRRVNSQPHPTQTIPRQEGRSRPEDVPEGAQPLTDRRLAQGSAEEQLSRLICDNELVKSYKLRAKDVYFDASLYALNALRNVVRESDPALKPEKMAREFNKALKTVQGTLKNMNGANASDLKITVDTAQHGKVQLIPFKLKAVRPEQLQELLDIALKLTEDALQEWRNSSDYSLLRTKYTESIAQHSPQIDHLLAGIHPDNKEAFRIRIDALQFPGIQILFGSDRKITIENASESTEPRKQHTIAKKDRMMDEAVELYRQQTGREVPEEYVKKQKALAVELQKLQRIAEAAPATDVVEAEDALVEEILPDKPDSLFRGILALVNTDRHWIHDATSEKVAEEIQRADSAQSIEFAVAEVINVYQEFAPLSDAQRIIAERLHEGAQPIVKAICNNAFAPDRSPRLVANDLAKALGIETMLTGKPNDPYALELGILAKMLYKRLLAEFEIPESDGRNPGLRWRNGRYSLIVAKDSPLAPADPSQA